MGLGDILIILFIVLVLAFIGITVLIVHKKVQRKNEEALARCTAPVQGVLVGLTQTHSHVGNHEHDHYNYNPIVRYEFAGQIYEKEYNSECGDWESIQPEQPLTIFVNPNHAEDIYVPLPDDFLKKKNKKTKVFLIIFAIFLLGGLIGGILTDK